MQKHAFIFYLFIFFFTSLSSAQTPILTTDLLVLNNGDTLRGVLKPRVNPGQKISIQPAGSSAYQEYSVDAVRSYFLKEGFYYKPVAVPTENGTEQQFLVCLVEGGMSLYKIKEYYLLQKENGPLTKLEKQYPQKGSVQIDTHYRRLLRYLMSDCPKALKQIEKTGFTDRQLAYAVENYNWCKNPDLRPKTQPERFKIKLKKGVRASLTFNNMAYDDGELTDFNVRRFDMGSTASVTGGIYLNVAFGHRFSFQPELIYIKRKGSYTGLFSGLYPRSYNVSETLLQIPGSLYYTIPGNKVRPFIGVGGTVGIVLNSKIEKKLASDIDYEDAQTDSGARTGLGLEYRLTEKSSLFLEYIYERSILRTQVLTRNVQNQSHYISLRFGF